MSGPAELTVEEVEEQIRAAEELHSRLTERLQRTSQLRASGQE